MQMVMEGLLALGLLLAGFWVWSVRGSVARDQAETQRRQKQEDEHRAQAEREAQLQRKGARLRCLSCDTAFRGPLPPTGCPSCHLVSFVVPETKTREKKKEG